MAQIFQLLGTNILVFPNPCTFLPDHRSHRFCIFSFQLSTYHHYHQPIRSQNLFFHHCRSFSFMGTLQIKVFKPVRYFFDIISCRNYAVSCILSLIITTLNLNCTFLYFIAPQLCVIELQRDT